ncbi:MAG TPA: hypothetical protein VFD12_01225 [Oligella sp.]|nr:hypothetical protein [Oligella sp.]
MMKNKFIMTTLGSALAIGLTVAANQAVADIKVPLSGTVKLGTTACGSYTDAIFDKSGNLTLTGNSWTCLEIAGSDNDNDNDNDNDSGNGNGNGNGNGDNIPTGCEPASGGLVENFNNRWDQGIFSNVRNPIILSDTQAYSLKLNNSGKIGFGNFVASGTTQRGGTRTVTVSECPGSAKPAGVTYETGYNACSSSGLEPAISWTYHNSRPTGIGQCRLDPNKQYYINVMHKDIQGNDTCKGGTCYFIFDYTFRGLLN